MKLVITSTQAPNIFTAFIQTLQNLIHYVVDPNNSSNVTDVIFVSRESGHQVWYVLSDTMTVESFTSIYETAVAPFGPNVPDFMIPTQITYVL